MRLQREVGRSNFGAMFVNRQGVGRLAEVDDYNRAYGLDLAWQATTNGKLFAFMACTDSPRSKGGSDYAGRMYYAYPTSCGAAGSATRRSATASTRKSALQRRGYRHVEGQLQPELSAEAVAVDPPHPAALQLPAYTDLDNRFDSSWTHLHFVDIVHRSGARFGIASTCSRIGPRSRSRSTRTSSGGAW